MIGHIGMMGYMDICIYGRDKALKRGHSME